MKILFLSHQAEFIYGGEVVTLAFLEELRKQGEEVHFASPAGPYADRVRTLGVRHHEIPSVQFSRRLSSLPSLVRAWLRTRAELRKIIAQEAIHLVHATSLKAMVYAWALDGRVPVLWHHHDILPHGFWNNLWVRGLARGARMILAPSAATGRALVEAGVSTERVRVLRNGFSLAAWRARSAEGPAQPMRLAFIGELSARKGVDRLPDLFAEFSKALDCRLVIVGEAVSDPAFGEKIRGAFIGQAVELLGRRNDVKEILQQVDILLVPSRQDPLPTVIVEAGLSGVPVVASPVGGIPEMVENGVNGYLAAEDAEWVARVKELGEPGLWQKCAKGARRVAEEKYDLQRLTGELRQHYVNATKNL